MRVEEQERKKAGGRRDRRGGAPAGGRKGAGRGRPVRFRLKVEYEGTRYRGWQVQENARTVQGELLAVARSLLGQTFADLQGAGRTDAGVHALEQGAHLDAYVSPSEAGQLADGLNEGLPHDIHVLEVRPAPPGFDARTSARERVYLYQVARRRSAFGKRLAWWVRDPLDGKAMARAAEIFPGEHDFRSFVDGRWEEGTRLALSGVEVVEEGALLLVRVRGAHFLWKVVRRVVGVLVEAGRGKVRPEDVRRFLAEPSPEPARWTAPPCGLFLERVLYPGDPPPGPVRPVLPVA